MKKILSVIASAFIVCALGLSACGHTDSGDNNNNDSGDNTNNDYEGNLLFEEVETDGVKSYFVKGFESTADEEVIIPSEYNGLPVTGISENAFDGCTEIESVTIGANVNAIGKSAFARCENVKSVHVERVEQWCSIAFANLGANPMYFATEFYADGQHVIDLVIPDSVTEIPAFAFYACDIKSVKTGRGLTKIGGNAFYGCEQLESAEINGKVEDMEELAFADCIALKDLVIGNEVEVIGDNAFLRCEMLEEVTIPSGVKTIENSAFLGCVKLREVHLSEGLKYIGDCAFSGCISLIEFNMPSSVNEIGYGILMFGGNYGFGGVVDSFNQVGKIVLSDSLTLIPNFSFSYCGIRTITIGNKVTQISYSSFYGCTALESVVIPQSVVKIESYAFYQCPMLNTVYYAGTAEEWGKITIGKNGNAVSTAEVYFYSEEQPAQEGNFWHYADGVPTKW